MQTVARLINQFIPENYNLSLTINRLERTFDGTIVIQGFVQSKNNSVIFHGKALNIKSVVFDGKSANFSYGDDDTLIVTHKDINQGKHIIVIDYSGIISDSMHGLYPCYYEHDGIKKELLTTQFESHHAREVFPCIDEPAAKATYDLTLTTEPNITVLGNMPIKIQKIENEKLVTTFETTPIMSSYLLAWVVGELHKKTAKTESGVEVNVWATPAQSDASLEFGLDVATRSIDFFNQYFGVDYPLPKSDHVALPDFSSGAMENWGLITYREIALLVDPKTTSITNKRYVATVIAHELSHQWFGNLVTMEWWNDLWLNESFASIVEYIAIDALEPSWNVWLDFASFDTIAALRRDSLAGVQSVQTDVSHPDEISALFDGAIVYAKGARLLQMLRYYIGDEAFQTGLKHYFKIHAYKNTTTHDLWSAFKDASHKNVETFMHKWISQPGFPVLHVSKQANQIILSQNRLTNKLSSPSDTLWPIPLNSNSSKMPKLFDAQTLTIDWDDNLPIRFNVGNNAHFITHYDHTLLSQIILQLKNGELLPIDRLQLLNEQTILANAGIISSAELIPLLGSFAGEMVESVWDIISLAIGDLRKFVENDDNAESKLRALVKSLAKTQYGKLGWTAKPNELEADTKLRSLILGLMLYSEDSDVIVSAINIHRSTPLEKLDPELRSIVLTSLVRHSNDGTNIKSLIEAYNRTDSAELKQDICIGLTSTHDPKIITKFLNMIKNTSIIRTQDASRWIIYLMRNRYSRVKTWQWIRDNWNWINQTFSGDKSYDEYPRYVAATLSTVEQFNEYKQFFEPMLTNPALTRVITMGINEIKNRVDSIERDGETVRQALLNF